MKTHFSKRWSHVFVFGLFALFLVVTSVRLFAQSTATLTGTVVDPKGSVVTGAAVIARNDATHAVRRAVTDGQGRFSFSAVPAGTYTVEISAPGFEDARRSGVQLASGASEDISLSLALSKVTQQVTVQADEVNSVAAQLAPMTQSLAATSARTEISAPFIQNFTAPTADYGEIVQMVPGTFTLNSNGVGLGQSKTYFRGFPDGDYDIDFDGINFYDTNSPTHHSWVFFPSQWIGGVDFDRSPGTASTVGPTPFGGSIHLLSRELSPIQNIRGAFSYGSWNTKLFDAQYDSGSILPNHKLSLEMDFHHMSSDGYQTYNFQKRDAGSIKAQYKFSDKTVLTGFSGVLQTTANSPNFNPTRCQMYGATSAYSCTGTLAPFAGSGLNFYLTDNSDPYNFMDYQYNHYHIPTDFEYVGLRSELGHGFTLDIKPYTYNYDNAELYSNNTPMTEQSTINGSKTYMGLNIQPCNVAVVKKGVTAIPCGVDKYNSYRKYGETSTLSQVSKFGVLRVGAWYEWARTDRHQYPTDPLNDWADQALPNFAEQFWTNSYQPFAEYEFHVTRKLNITAGTKFSYYTINTKQYADDGKTIGPLATSVSAANPKAFISNSGSYFATLPSIDANYRLKSNWSVYGQLATGSIVPPSNVFDFNQGPTGQPIPVETLPKQQRSTTYQTGTVLKLNRLTFDADYYHIRFQNSYSSTPDANNNNEPVYFLQPSSITQGFEAESNVYFGHGLSAFVNGSVGKANYVGKLPVSCTGTAATGCTSSTPQLMEQAPSRLWVQQTPHDTEAVGATYQNKGFDLGFFNKRVGTFYIDNGAYHNQATVDPFNTTNTFLNYTIRTGGRFDQTKIRLSFNNLFNQHSITGVSPTGSVQTQTIAANGTTYTDQFNTNGPTPISGGDNMSILPGRSVTISVQFGLSPKR
ncbi:MAG TPA: TonB-dependent receptor [Edaphobacter sp.]